MTAVYKICSAAEWREAIETGAYHGSAVDRNDGFVHLSAEHQVRETAQRHFAAKRDLVLIALEAEALGPGLKWEPSRGGDPFPHFYGVIPTARARWTAPLPWENGRHRFPPGFE